jgi:hypothetical protein
VQESCQDMWWRVGGERWCNSVTAKVVLSAGALLVLSCGDGTRTVSGQWTWNYIAPNPVVVLRDLTPYQFRVYVSDARDVSLFPPDGPVRGTQFGSYEVPDVPDGPYLVKAEYEGGFPFWFAYADSAITREILVRGRPNAEVARASTLISVDASNLAPWATDDLLVATCWENATDNVILGTSLQPPVASGATGFQSRFDWGGSGASSSGPGGVPYLMDPTQGDTLSLARLALAYEGDAVGRSTRLVQVANAPAPAQRNLEESSVAMAFVDVPVDRQITVALDADGFESAAAARGMTPSSWYAAVYTGPGANHGLLNGPPLVDVYSLSISVEPMTLQFGHPYNQAWASVVTAELTMEQLISLPGLGPLQVPSSTRSRFWRDAPLGPSFHFGPTVTASVTLNHAPPDERFIPWNGTAPIRLNVQASDASARFSLDLFEVVKLGTATALDLKTNILLGTQREVWLPPEMFQRGKYHALRVGAYVPGENGSEGSYIMTGKFLLDEPSSSRCGDGVVDPATGETCDDGSGNCSC